MPARERGEPRWEAAHVRADLGDQNLGHAAADSGNRIHSFDDRVERADSLGDLGADAVDALVQCIVVRQLLGQQKALVGTCAAGNCPLKTGTLIPKAALSQVRQRRGVGGAGYHRGQNGPAGGAQHVAGNITQFDVCALQRLLESICLSCPLAHQGGAIARQFAQLALRSIRHEAWTQQPMA
jgi:hypothetical protein